MHELSLEWRRTRGKNGIYADGKLRKVSVSFDSAGHEREDVVEYRAAKLPSFLHVWFNSEVFLWDPSTERFQELHRDILKQPDWKPKYVLVFQDESIVRNLFLYICYYAQFYAHDSASMAWGFHNEQHARPKGQGAS